MFKAIKRFLIWLNIMAERASETDAINEAIVENNIRRSKERADQAVTANGKLNSQMILLKQQIRGQENKVAELKLFIADAVKRNDETNGAVYAEQLGDLETDLTDNKQQLQGLDEAYKQNTEIIAESIRQIQKMERDFVALKAKVKISRNMENLASMMKSSITELSGIVGGEASNAMQRMREAAASGQGQVTATMDLARSMGSNIRMQQEARKARGRALFEQYKSQLAPEVTVATPAPTANTDEKPRIAGTEKVSA